MKRYSKSIFTALVSLCLSLFLFPEYADASYDVALQQTKSIQKAVENYAKKIENSYHYADRSAFTDSEMKLASKQIVDSEDLLERGLILSNVKVNAVVDSIKKVADNYEIKSDITTSFLLRANKDTDIVIAGQKRNTLHSSATDTHIITVESKGSTNNSFVVTGDKIQNPVEDSGEIDDYYSYSDKQDRSILEDKSNKKITYNPTKASLYAEKWTEKNIMNPVFPIHEEKGTKGNCTNFVSQAVYAGGLPTTFGTSFDRANPKVWTWNLAGIARDTYTWSGAEYNYNYMKNYSGIFKPDNAWRIGFGGIIYADWKNTGHLGHAMFVVGYAAHRNKPTPIICQKSANRHDWPFSTSVKMANKNYGGKTRWVGLQSLY